MSHSKIKRSAFVFNLIMAVKRRAELYRRFLWQLVKMGRISRCCRHPISTATSQRVATILSESAMPNQNELGHQARYP